MNVKRITIDNLSKATTQEVFDHIANHLLTQNEQAMHGAVCVYRARNGFACAAGSLFDFDNPAHAVIVAEHNMKAWPLLIRYRVVPDAHSTLIRSLQKVHDNELPGKWHDALKNLCKCIGLEWKFG